MRYSDPPGILRRHHCETCNPLDPLDRLCEVCQSLDFNRAKISHRHNDMVTTTVNSAQLEASAANGCKLCSFVLEVVLFMRPIQGLQNDDGQERVGLHLFETGPPEIWIQKGTSSGDNIQLYSGAGMFFAESGPCFLKRVSNSSSQKIFLQFRARYPFARNLACHQSRTNQYNSCKIVWRLVYLSILLAVKTTLSRQHA